MLIEKKRKRRGEERKEEIAGQKSELGSSKISPSTNGVGVKCNDDERERVPPIDVTPFSISREPEIDSVSRNKFLIIYLECVCINAECTIVRRYKEKGTSSFTGRGGWGGKEKRKRANREIDCAGEERGNRRRTSGRIETADVALSKPNGQNGQPPSVMAQ